MKTLNVAVLASLVASAPAQIPDLKVRLDATFNHRTEGEGPTTLRTYNTLGKHSILGFAFLTEPGFRVYVSQRFQRIPNDADKSLIDEFYVEDEGLWRLGKQYLPFGSGEILRESVNAARGDTSLLIENFAVSLAICDNGPGMQRGIVGRIGKPLGFSFALGEHFGIAGSALTYIRHPEDSPGKGRGYREVYGVDYTRRKDFYIVKAEFVWLRKGETPLDASYRIYDVSATLAPSRYKSIGIGWTRQFPDRADIYRLQGSLYLGENVTLEPLVRWRDSKFWDASIALRIRM